QSVALGIGMMLALFHSLGVLPEVIIWLKSFMMATNTTSGLPFQHSYVILEEPAALLFGKPLITSTTSPIVISVLTESKASFLIDHSDLYSSSHWAVSVAIILLLVHFLALLLITSLTAEGSLI